MYTDAAVEGNTYRCVQIEEVLDETQVRLWITISMITSILIVMTAFAASNDVGTGIQVATLLLMIWGFLSGLVKVAHPLVASGL